MTRRLYHKLIDFVHSGSQRLAVGARLREQIEQMRVLDLKELVLALDLFDQSRQVSHGGSFFAIHLLLRHYVPGLIFDSDLFLKTTQVCIWRVLCVQTEFWGSCRKGEGRDRGSVGGGRRVGRSLCPRTGTQNTSRFIVTLVWSTFRSLFAVVVRVVFMYVCAHVFARQSAGIDRAGE